MKILMTISIFVMLATALFPDATHAAACGPLPADHEARDKIVTTYRDGRIGVECPQLKIEAPNNIKTLVNIEGVDGGQGKGNGTYDLPLAGNFSVRITDDANKELTQTGCTGTIAYGETKTCTITQREQVLPTSSVTPKIEHEPIVEIATPTKAPTEKEQVEQLQKQIIQLQEILKQLLELLVLRLQTQP